MNKIFTTIHRIMKIVLYPIRFIFPLIFLLVFKGGIYRTVDLIFGLSSYHKGIVIDITDVNDPIGGRFPNKIDFIVKDIKSNKEYIIGTGTKYNILIGDTLDFRSYYKTGEIALKKNGIQFTEPWGVSNIYLPILSIIIGWFYYKFYVKPLYLKYIKKKK